MFLLKINFFQEVKSLVNLHKLEVEILNCKDLNDKDLLNEDEIISGKLSDNVCTMFTSGTSGPSKGVMMPNAHCVLFAIGTIENYNLRNNHIFTSPYLIPCKWIIYATLSMHYDWCKSSYKN